MRAKYDWCSIWQDVMNQMPKKYIREKHNISANRLNEFIDKMNRRGGDMFFKKIGWC